MTMSAGTPFNFLDQDLLLLPQKAIYWQQEKALIAADVHLGKVGHFRKAGIAIPRDMEQDDLAMLSDLIAEHRPEKIIFLGDLFHSDLNADWDWFVMWRKQFPKLQIILVKGNHDIIHDKHYLDLDIVLTEELSVGPFLMLHHPLADPNIRARRRLCALRAYPSRRKFGWPRQAKRYAALFRLREEPGHTAILRQVYR
jgi:DNA ligase-associated metallophosphoesterase